MSPSPFLPYWGTRRTTARATLVCLPHAGAGASAYRGWLRGHDDLDVQPVQLPGRETLLRLPLVDRAERLVEPLGRALIEIVDRPFVLFGHSMGASLAAELTAWLAERGEQLPELLVVSSRQGGPIDEAHLARDLGSPDVSDEELVRRVLVLCGTDLEALANHELRALVLPVLRNDIQLLRAYRPTFRRLPVPILALGGAEDTVSAEQLSAWRHYGDGRFRVRTFPGNHFYLHQQASAVLREICAELVLLDRS